jgi:apolipoprotein D and lipocalin family protein
MKRLAIVLGGVLVMGCATSTTKRLRLPPLQTASQVDLQRYLGTWYEIASFPHRFQKGCTATTATYSQREDGDIDVFNRCRKGGLDGKETSARGRARVKDPASNAKLEVSFFRPFWGAYWILEVGPEYDYAVVGHPSRDYLWILSRTPTLEPALYGAIVRRLAAQGYETDRLSRTSHPEQQGAGPR